MIQKIIELTTEYRLNIILDKILDNIKLKDSDKIFLESFSLGKEEIINAHLNETESKVYFSDNGNFKFIFMQYEEQDNCKIITGTLIMPNNGTEELNIRCTGNILVFGSSHVALDFKIGEIDIFELLLDKEEELDDFIYEIIDHKI